MKIRKRLSTFQIIVLGFALLILAGTFLLMLPISTQGAGHASFADALFTAVSACCVTGLVVQDTATYWTTFGQCIILALIQIGGMGVVTFAMMFAILSGRKIGIMQRATLQAMVDAPQIGGIVAITKFILKMTALIECLGAAFMYPVFSTRYGVIKGIWYSIFHSISAFCNAGFDLMGEKEAFSSLTSFQENVWINLVIMLLIIIGGVGFFTLYDVIKYTYHFPKYSLQTKAILPITMALLSIPAFYLYIVEFSQPSWNGLGMKEKILAAAFQSVTTRTAGFNTVNLGNMCEASLLILIILMLIGGSPGSTAGGFKTTTLGVLAAGCIAVFKQKSDVNLCGRRVDDDTVRCAATIFVSYLFFFLTGSILISISEGVPVLPAMFEAASAIGTVGLSLGITPGIGCMARVVLIFLMFFGRAGALTLVFCAIPRKANTFSRLPHEKIMVG